LLKNLPIDVLKIDSFFFDEGPDRSRDMALVESIVTLVKKFDIRTVAEGIESMEQVEYLKRIGCDYVQGYVFYRPMPQQDYETLLTEAG
jgi:EAL domain-containing protein (putative c-di-GMP-specific phosphodiesterase class I)